MPATTTRRPSGRRLAPPVRASHSVRTRACSANWTASRQQRFQVGAVQNRIPPNMRAGRSSPIHRVTVFRVLSFAAAKSYLRGSCTVNGVVSSPKERGRGLKYGVLAVRYQNSELESSNGQTRFAPLRRASAPWPVAYAPRATCAMTAPRLRAP